MNDLVAHGGRLAGFERNAQCLKVYTVKLIIPEISNFGSVHFAHLADFYWMVPQDADIFLGIIKLWL